MAPRRWPWEDLPQKERLVFSYVRAYMDFYDLWTNPLVHLDDVIRTGAAMSDEEMRAFIEMTMLNGLVN